MAEYQLHMFGGLQSHVTARTGQPGSYLCTEKTVRAPHSYRVIR